MTRLQVQSLRTAALAPTRYNDGKPCGHDGGHFACRHSDLPARAVAHRLQEVLLRGHISSGGESIGTYRIAGAGGQGA
jgi:hypothetical protein